MDEPWQPKHVFLFSGHMIDTPDRRAARFPASIEHDVAEAISTTLDELGMSAADLSICGGACGGDILFAEAAVQRECQVHLHLQFEEKAFLEASVAFAGESWVRRFLALKQNSLVRLRVLPEAPGLLQKGMNPYIRNNLWQLDAALAHGSEKVRFLALWNGEEGSAQGGTAHMLESARNYGVKIGFIDIRKLVAL